MADRKATNKYYPPDWDPSKGSVNKHKKSHPLRDRARKLDQGILIVRFEMPFNVWCLKCENLIGMGVRYNAEKSKVGQYYSSPIYKFRMKCHLCDNHFEIRTEPSKFDYIILSGARKQARLGTVTSDELDQVVIDQDEAKRRMADAMFRLEKKVEDKIKSEAKLPDLQELKHWRSRWEDSFAANQLVRAQYRKRRNQIEQRRQCDKKLLEKTCLKIPLLKSQPSDKILAKKILEESKYKHLEKEELEKRKEILSSSMTIIKSERIKTPRLKTSDHSCQRQQSSSRKSQSSLNMKRDPG